MRLLQATSYIHSSLSLEYGSADEPSETQLAFHCLHVELAEKEEAFRVATVEIGTLQALLDTKRQSFTLGPSLERELVWLHHAYTRLSEITRYLGFDAARLLHTHSSDDPILFIGFRRLCQAMSDQLGHV